MSRAEKRDLPRSIFHRLLNKAKENGDDFNLLLSRYGMERLLFRLSVSPYAERFILKGASLFLVWKGRGYRVTRDVDLLGSGNPEPSVLFEIFRSVCETECPEDGMEYPTDCVRAVEIREGREYTGVRITMTGLLHHARIPLQLDVGFGDVITPAAETVEYPVILDGPAPRLRAYPKYTLLAEKLEAMVGLGFANSRMKDFFDMWVLSTLFGFDGEVLSRAVANTFHRRRTSLPEALPFAFTASFYDDQQKKAQWKAFVRKTKPDVVVESLSSVVSDLLPFIMPVLESLRSEIPFQKNWLPGKGWIDSKED